MVSLSVHRGGVTRSGAPLGSIRVLHLKSRNAASASRGMRPKNWDRSPTWLTVFVLEVLFMGILLFATDDFRGVRIPAAHSVSHSSPAP
jgi:hypothetical protein